MTTDPRIEAAAKAIQRNWLRMEGNLAEAALAAADAVDPLRNPTEDDIERAAEAAALVVDNTRWDHMGQIRRDEYMEAARSVVAALRGQA